MNKPDASPLKAELPTNVESRVRMGHVHEKLFGHSLSPVKISRFTLLECIGSGGMGEVYAAYDEQLDRKVAIKLVRRGKDTQDWAQERLLREAQTLARLSHPNVIHVYEAGIFEGRAFIAMEFVHGTNLRHWLNSNTSNLEGVQRVNAVLQQFIAIGRGLQAAHAAGVVHRDFKPENVLISGDGRPRVADFGLALAVTTGDPEGHPKNILAGEHMSQSRTAATSLTTMGRVMGTPRYMSPEQLRGEVADSRSDQFSFCVALYEALYDRYPFDDQQGFDGTVRPPPPQTDVPPLLYKVLCRGMSAHPDDRFADMDTLLRALGSRNLAKKAATLGASPPLLPVAIMLGVVSMAVAEEHQGGLNGPESFAVTAGLVYLFLFVIFSFQWLQSE